MAWIVPVVGGLAGLVALAGVIFLIIRHLTRARLAALEWSLAWSQVESDPEAGLKAFRKALKRLTKQKGKGVLKQRAQAHFGAALCLVRLKRFDEAAQEEEEARRRLTLTADEERRLCGAYLAVAGAEPSPPSALAAYQRYLAVPPAERAAPTYEAVEGALRRALTPAPEATPEDVTAAGRLALRLLKQQPDLDWVQFALGLIYLRLNQRQKALESLQQAVAAAPNSAERQEALARAHHALGQKAAARAALLRAYRLAPVTDSAWRAALACLDASEPFTPAEREVAGDRPPLEFGLSLLQGPARDNASRTDYWVAVAEFQMRLGQPAEAATSAERALVLDPQSPTALAQRGAAAVALGDNATARAALERSLQHAPNLPQALEQSGDLAYAEGDYDNALRHYQRLAAVNPAVDRTDALARCFLETGQPAEVVRVLVGRTHLPTATRLCLGRARGRMGQWAEALEVLQAEDGRATTSEYRFYLANALGANGKYAEAAALLEPLLADPAWRMLAQRALGHVRLLGGDAAGAERCYHEVRGLPTAPLDFGRLGLVRGDAAAARDQFARAMEQNEGEKAAQLGLALAEARLGDTARLASLARDDIVGPWAEERLADEAYSERRYVEALEVYERAIRGRTRVSTGLLVRLAVGYLQLNRHREALPHLVELTRRRPSDPAIRYNLAVCRYHLGRGYFRQGRWDQARGEWSRCVHLLRPEPVAEAVQRWELEAAYRAASALLRADPPTQLDRAVQLCRAGLQAAATDPRWSAALALALALSGKHTEAAPAFATARERAPNRVGLLLGEGLSLLATGEHERARGWFEQVAERTRSAAPDAPEGVLHLAARLAVVVAHARDRRWIDAAGQLEPLLKHPLIRSGKRIGPADLAQIMVAYLALGGEKDRASAAARQHLPGGRALGNVLIGMVQAEAGDYAGAATTLEEAYREERNPVVRNLLVECLLAAAAECVRQADLKTAEAHAKRALGHDPKHAAAKRLAEALAFGREFQKLDLSQLDKAIAQCDGLVQAGGASIQLLRTLGVLHHRKALGREKVGKGDNRLWEACVDFWKRHVLDSDSFWERYPEEFNAGKSRREQVKSEDVAKWREELPTTFAQAHAGYAGAALKKGDAGGVQRHLDLIWAWKSDFEPPKDFLLADLGNIDESTVEMLEKLLKKLKNPEVKASLGRVAGGYWNGKAVQAGNEGQAHFGRAFEHFQQGINVWNAAMQAINSNPYAVAAASGVLRQARDLLGEARDEAREARSLVRRARGYLDKAVALAPGEAHLRKNQSELGEISTQVEKLCEVADTQHSQMNGQLRQLGI